MKDNTTVPVPTNVDATDKFYPSADEWMWDYCVFLGKFTDDKGQDWDLGIHPGCEVLGPSFAMVYGNSPGKYISGSIRKYMQETNEKFKYQTHDEAIRRAKAYLSTYCKQILTCG